MTGSTLSHASGGRCRVRVSKREVIGQGEALTVTEPKREGVCIVRTSIVIVALLSSACAGMSPLAPGGSQPAYSVSSSPVVTPASPAVPYVPPTPPVSLAPELPTLPPVTILPVVELPPPVIDYTPVAGHGDIVDGPCGPSPCPPLVYFSCPVGLVPVLRDVLTCEAPTPVLSCPVGTHAELRDTITCELD